MANVRLQRIQYGTSEAQSQLDTLRAALGSQGNVVSAKGRELTIKVFGEPLTPVQVVQRICQEVQQQGLEAVLHYTEQLDQKTLTPETVRVSAEELKEARAQADAGFLNTIRQIRKNVMSFQFGLIHRNAIYTVNGKHELTLRYRPMKRVGVMVPGGAAAYPSTLLMTICPAQAAGVKEIAVVMPPTPFGAYNQDLLAVCHELGVSEVYRIGGAQAVAALAYGVENIPGVDMIVGPGNLFVALAKKEVYGQVTIDCIAGPSEVIVIADETAPPAFVAADMIAQAEHSPGSSILITTHAPLLDQIESVLEEQLQALPRGELARESLEQFGALILARHEQDIIDCTNALAPEHLHIATENAKELAHRIDNAGAIFVGHYSPVAVGDYAAGPSHVLPTGGTARFTSGLSATDFLRRSSIIDFTEEGLKEIAPHVVALADKEGLTAHAASVSIRLDNTNS